MSNFYVRVGADTMDMNQAADSSMNKINQADAALERHKHKLATVFQWSLHLVSIWAHYAARVAEGTQFGIGMSKALQAISIASAEMSVFMTTKRAMSDLIAGRPAAATMQFLLAASMQYMIFDMELEKQKTEALERAAERTRSFFEQYS
jgi:hypothetical protein